MVPSDSEFAAFLAQYEPRVHRALVAAYGVQEGRSAAQAAMTWAWEHWDRIETLSNVAGYLYRVGLTAATRSRPRDLVIDRPLAESVADDGRVDPDLVAALDNLSPQQRASVVLVHGHGYTLRDAGEVLGLNPSTVRIHVQRGLNKLRRTLEVQHVG
jgi:RNA polymerase sigma factor (sigma-70 family)